MRAAIIGLFLLTCFGALSAQDQTGTIVFYREPHASTSHVKPFVFCDGSELARIENGTYFQVTAPAGPHACTAESLLRSSIEVDVVAGQTTYVHVAIQPGFKEHALVANTMEAEYKKQEPRLKPTKEWSRDSLRVSQSLGTTDAPSSSASAKQPTGDHEDSHSGKFGDLAVSVSEFVVFPAQDGRASLEVFVSAANTGKGVICASLDATLNTTFGLQYHGTSGQAPRMQEMLPGESTKGGYVFDIKNGVQPLELVFKLATFGHGIRCRSAAPAQDGLIPDQIRLDARELPVNRALPASR
jgi:hypothetical protein